MFRLIGSYNEIFSLESLSTSVWQHRALSSEKDIVLRVVWLRLSNVHGRGTTAAEKQQSLQSLIRKYANERVIKIGRLSVALWLLMNSNLQERGRGWWAKNLKKEQDAIVPFLIFLLKHEKSQRMLYMHKGLSEKKNYFHKNTDYKLTLNINKMTVPIQKCTHEYTWKMLQTSM